MPARTLQQWLEYLEQLHPSEMELGLERIRTVAQRMNVLRPAGIVITVTGTNGKGSTCAFLASLLARQRLKTGVYSSPHFLRYNERIQIAGEPVSDALICQAFEAVEQARQNTSLTYFEFGTLAALWIFSRAGLDVAILEVGLGGRLDAVNLVDADIAVITSIAVDHSDWLGDTRESVAFEKAGIFRQGKPAVCGDLQPPQILHEQAQQLDVPLSLRGRDFDLAITQQAWHWRGVGAAQENMHLHDLPLLDLPMENAALALQVYALLELPWQPEIISAALQATRLTGRLQRLQLEYRGRLHRLILDVAHNPHAAEYLAERLAGRLLAGKRHAVFGALSDKDVAGVIAAMAKGIDSWAIAQLPSPRSCTVAQLEQLLLARDAEFTAHDSIPLALEAVLERSDENDEILIFGSFFTVTQVLEYVGQS